MRGSAGFVEAEFRTSPLMLLAYSIPMLTGAFLIAWLGGSFMAGRGELIRSPRDFIALGLGFVIIVGFFGFLYSIFSVLFPTGIGAKGIRSYDGLGIYREIEWEEISRAKFVSLLGLPYIFIYRRGFFDSVCFATTINNSAAMRQAFDVFVPEANPLRPVLIKTKLLKPDAPQTTEPIQ